MLWTASASHLRGRRRACRARRAGGGASRPSGEGLTAWIIGRRNGEAGERTSIARPRPPECACLPACAGGSCRAGLCSRRLGFGLLLGLVALLAGLGAARLLHVDAAAEVRPFGNRDARCGNVAVHRPVIADIDLVARGNVAGHLAEDDHRLREHLRLDLSVGADRQHVLAKFDLPLDLSLDRQVFAAVELALDDNGFTYVHSSSLLSTLRVAGRSRTRRRCRIRGMRRGYRLRRGWPGAGRCSRLDRFIPFPHWAILHTSEMLVFPRLGSRVTRVYERAGLLSSPFSRET